MLRLDGIVIEKGVPCVMRDGTVLFADVYRPQSDEPLPVLLMRQPYGRSLASTVTYAHPVWYARHGFIVVIQDVRGRGDSLGVFDPFTQELEDGYDAVEWAACLPGSNGKVGMYGFSYQGYTQLAAAAVRPPHLVAIAPAMCAADLYHGWFYPLGRLALGATLPWAAQLARDEARRRNLPDVEERMTEIMENPGPWLRHLPLNHVPEIMELAPFYRDWVEHHAYDDYWAARDLLPRLREACVPAYHIGGWFDPYLQGTLQTFVELYQAEHESSRHQRLLIGPWAHIPWGGKVAGNDYGRAAAGHVDQEMIRWFNFWLKGKGDIHEGPPIRYFELGSNTWKTADRWPEAGEECTRVWYMGSVGDPANGALGGGLLQAESAPSDGSIDLFVYDARLPMQCDSFLPADRSVIQQRNEILVYTSPPLEKAIHVLGSPRVVLWVNAVGGPTDLVAILTVVHADGSAKFLSVGRELVPIPTSANGKEGDKEPDRETEDDLLQLVITMRPIAAELKEGNSIRLELTGSAFPLIARHPNRIAEPDIPSAGPERLQIATVAVASSARTPSRIILPLRPDSDREGEIR